MKVRTAARPEILALFAAGCTSFAGLHVPDLDAGATAADASSVTGDAAVRGYRDTVMSDNPIAYWRFGEAKGATTANDEVGAHAGTYKGVTLGVDGALIDNTAANFQSGAMDVTDSSAFNFSNGQSFSLEVWARPHSLGTSSSRVMERIVAHADNDRDGYQMVVTATETFCELWQGATALGAQTGALPLNQYSHLVCTYDGSLLKLFVDGKQVDTEAAALQLQVTAQPFSVGVDSAFQFPGDLDEVAIYATALDVTKIQAHHAAASPR